MPRWWRKWWKRRKDTAISVPTGEVRLGVRQNHIVTVPTGSLRIAGMTVDRRIVVPTALRRSNAWSYPGIPYPTESTSELVTLGYAAWPYDPCTIDTPTTPSPWTSDQAGFIYVKDDGTDTGRTYGNPIAPRKTIPTLSAGDVVVIDGDYTTSEDSLLLPGTSSNPVFITGASGTSARFRARFQLNASSNYYIVDGVDGWFPGSGSVGKTNMQGTYGCYRNCTLQSDETTVGYGSHNIGSGHHHMIYNCTISGAGYLNTPTDVDTHGTKITPGVTDVWIIDSTYYNNSGDGVQIGDNVGTSRCERIFIGGCTAYGNRQVGFWSKTAQDVVFSNNVSYNHGGGVGGGGGGIGGQYDSDQIWVLFNTTYSNSVNVSFQGRSAATSVTRYAVVGNLMYDNTAAVASANDPNEEASLQNRGMLKPAIVDNTIVDVNAGIHSAVNTEHFVHGNIIDQPKETNGRSLYAPSENGSGSSNYNVFINPEEIGWQDNSRDTLTQHNTDTGEDANSIDDTFANVAFVNSAGRNYHLDTGSVARNASIEHGIYAEFEARYGLSIKVDRDGNARPTSGSWDAGCYQDS